MSNHSIPTLDQFIEMGSKAKWPLNKYVLFPGFSSLYVRYGSFRYVDEMRMEPLLDLASLNAEEPGKGAFTKLHKHLRVHHPDLWLYVESVLNERFEKKLEKVGYIRHEGKYPPCFYMPSVQVRMMNEQ